MKTLKNIALCMALGFAAFVVIPNPAEASPSTTQSQTAKKKVKKPKKKTEVRKAESETVAQSNCYNGLEDSPSAYFACERKMLEASRAQSATTTEPTRQVKSSCGSNGCSSGNVITVASKYEGLNARRDRYYLRKVLSEPFDKDVDPALVAWCAAFANAVLQKSGYGTTDSLMARSFLSYGKKTNDPSVGDIVVFTRGRNSSTGHVAFFIGFDETGRYVKVIGGNQNKSVTVGYYPINRVLGYRKPLPA